MLYYDKNILKEAEEAQAAAEKEKEEKELEEAMNELQEMEIPVIEQCDDYMEAGFQICAETTENWNRLMEAIAIDELAYVMENGKEMIYEAEENKGRMAAFFDKAIAAVKRFFAKVASLIDHFIGTIMTFTKQSEKYINSHKSELSAGLKAVKDKGLKRVGYNYHKGLGNEFNTKIDSTISGMCSEAKRAATSEDSAESFIKDYSGDALKGILDSMCASICTGSTKKTFAKDYAKLLAGGEEIDLVEKTSEASEIVRSVVGKLYINTAKQDKADAAKTTANEIKEIKAAKKSAEKGANTKVYTTAISAINAMNNVITTAISARITAANKMAHQYAGFARFCVAHAPKAQKESAMTPGNMLNSVEFI